MEAERNLLYEQITALVDHELDDTYVDDLKQRISSENDLQMEFGIQSVIKNLLRERFTLQSAPNYLYKNILNKINSEN